MESLTPQVYLGFIEPPKKYDFHIEKFPSKIGGSPIWLFPFSEVTLNLSCDNCKAELYFLCQLYAPLDTNPKAFHRSLYVFFCKSCWKSFNAVKIIRLQLPENSNFFKSEEALFTEDDLINNSIIKNLKFKTLSPEYNMPTNEEDETVSKLCLKNVDAPEFQIEEDSDMEDDDGDDDDDDDDEEDTKDLKTPTKVEDPKLNKMLKDYYKDQGDQTSEMNKLINDIEGDNFDKLTKNVFKTDKDKVFKKFEKIVKSEGDQVVRYCRGIEPLWFSQKGMLDVKKLRKCQYCQGNLIYEFQIMPEIFNIYQEITNIDIGTIVIFTCQNSCDMNIISEECGYIQRTGEAMIEFDNAGKPIKNQNQIDAFNDKFGSLVIEEKTTKIVSNDKLDNAETDEDGWIEVKNTKKTKKEKVESEK